MTTRIHTNTTHAVFQVDGQPDTNVRVLSEPNGDVSFSIDFDDGAQTIQSAPVSADRVLQLAESLQFIADTISSTIPGRLSPFARGWINNAAEVHYTAVSKGFWEDGDERNNGELLCLVHSEVSEALEALRHGNPPDEKISEFSSVEAELADVVIRVMDLAHARGWRVAQAVEAKMKFNNSRPYKHGKGF